MVSTADKDYKRRFVLLCPSDVWCGVSNILKLKDFVHKICCNIKQVKKQNLLLSHKPSKAVSNSVSYFFNIPFHMSAVHDHLQRSSIADIL